VTELDLSWLPAGVARRQALDEAQHSRELAREESARKKESERRAEDAYDKAVAAHMADSIARGEPVGALDVMRGGIGRTVSEVLTANAELADRVPKEHRDPVNYVGDTGAPVQRSRGDGWPSSEYQVDSLLARADRLHRDFVAARARHDYAGAAEAAQAKQDAVRSGRRVPMIGRAAGGEVTRVADADGMGQLGTWLGDAAVR
jgi:hypothetical protein